MAEESAAPAVEVPPELAARAKVAGWSEPLVLELLQRGAQPADLTRYMTMGVTEDQVRQFMAAQAEGGGPPAPQLDLVTGTRPGRPGAARDLPALGQGQAGAPPPRG